VADYGREDANTSYAWVALYTRSFLDDYLKHEASAKAFPYSSRSASSVRSAERSTRLSLMGNRRSAGARNYR
jgi:hypothetical protein